MSVHPSQRLPAAPTDAAAAPTADAAGGSDLFNILVAGLAGTSAAPVSADADPETPSVDGALPSPAAAKEVPESVEQLLALVGASRTHAAGKGKGAPSEEEAKQKDSGSDTPPESDQPTPQLLAAAAAPAPSPIASGAPPEIAGTSPRPAAAPAVIVAAATSLPAALAALPATAPAAPAAAPAAQAQPDATLSPSTADPTAAPQAAPAQEAQAQPASAPPQMPAPSANEAASAAVKALLADLGAPVGDRHRSERPLTAESVQTASAALRQAEQPTGLNPAPAPLAPAQPQHSAQAAASAPLQGLVIERQLDLAHQQDWIDQLARDISSAAGGDGGTLRFRLNPEHLGTLHVEIAQSHHGAAVRFSADTEAARSIIADAQPRLVAEARAQGVRISEAHVDLGSGGSGDPRRQAAAPGDVPIRTARSLQEKPASAAGDGKSTSGPRELYA